MSKPTIIDIAKNLNISNSTVSRALSNHPDVSQKTKDKVRTMAKDINYYPNIIAQSLKRGHSNIIGVLVPQVRHYFFAEIMAGISDILDDAGYNVIICQSNEKYEKEVKNVNTLIQQRVAGMLVSISEETTDFDHFRMLATNKIPLVFFDRTSHEVEASTVSIDDFKAAFDAVEHLIKKGYKKIAHLAGFTNLEIARDRTSGYKAALTKHNIEINENLIIENGLNEEDGAKSFLELYHNSQEKPDAIFAVTDPVAIGAFQEIKKMGLKIPQDIALVGFSNNPISSLIEPALTTINQPAYEIGQEAAKILLNQINNKDSKPEHKYLPTELIIRQTT